MSKSPAVPRTGSLPMPGMTAGPSPVRQLAAAQQAAAACAEFQAPPAWRKKGDGCTRCGQPPSEHAGTGGKQPKSEKKKVEKEKKVEKDKEVKKVDKDKPKESILSKLPAKVQPSDLTGVALKPISARSALPLPPSRGSSSPSLSSHGGGGQLPSSPGGLPPSTLSAGSPTVPTKARTYTESSATSAPNTPISPRMRGNSNPFLANSSPPASPRSSSFSSPHAPVVSFYAAPATSPPQPSGSSSSATASRELPATVSLGSSISSSLSTNDVVIHDKLSNSGGPQSPTKAGIVPVQPGKLSAFISSQATAELSKGQTKSSPKTEEPRPSRRSVLDKKKTKTLPSLDQAMLQSQINDPYGMGVSTYFRTMNNLLHALELKDDVIHQVEDLITKHRYIPSLEEKKLMQPIPLQAQNRLEKVVEDLTEFIKVQHRLRQIIKIQAVTRGYLARKQFKQFSELYVRGPLKARNEAFKELLRREKQYVANLQLIVKEYMKPLKENTKGYRALCTDKEVMTIFGNALLTVHSEMLHQLEIIQGRCPQYDGLGEVFLTMAPFFKAYGDYVNNFQNGVNTLLECKEKDRFASFIDEIYVELQKRNVYVDLHGLLSTPLNHIAGYETLIMSLVDSTPVGHKDHRSLSHCFSIISGTSRYIRDCIASADNIRNMQAIQDKLLKEKDKPQLLIASDHQRRVVKDGPCIIISQPAEKEKKKKDKERKGYLFAFNDILLVTRSAKGGYKVIDRLDMDQTKLEEPADSSDSFPIALTQNNRKYVFAIPTLIEKVVWVTELKRTIGYYEKTKIFGAPLSRLCDTKSGVPAIVERLAAHLEAAKAYEIVGIFRISGNISNINFLRDTIDRAGIGKEDDVNLAMSNVHDVSSVFKLFFREMPEPLLTYGLYDPVLRLMAGHTPEAMEKTLGEMAKLLKGLPKCNLQLLFWLLRYLNKYLQYSEQSKMTSSNISIVFSPNLCRPKQETIEYSLQLEKVNNAFELMINQHQQLAALVNP